MALEIMSVSFNFCYPSFLLWLFFSSPFDFQLMWINPSCWGYKKNNKKAYLAKSSKPPTNHNECQMHTRHDNMSRYISPEEYWKENLTEKKFCLKCHWKMTPSQNTYYHKWVIFYFKNWKKTAYSNFYGLS